MTLRRHPLRWRAAEAGALALVQTRFRRLPPCLRASRLRTLY